jgi:hypothetical protein
MHGSDCSKHFVRASVGLEHLAIVLCASAAGFSALPWPVAALGGGTVYLLAELAARDAVKLQRLSNPQIGPGRKIVGAAFIGAGHSCLGWAVGMAVRIALG